MKKVYSSWGIHSCEKSYGDGDFQIAGDIILYKYFQVSDSEIWWKYRFWKQELSRHCEVAPRHKGTLIS